MKIIINYTDMSLLKRLTFVLFAVLAVTGSAVAQSRIWVEDFTINPGEEKEVAVYFHNEDGTPSFQMDFTLPEGLSYISYKANTERIPTEDYEIDVTPQSENKTRFVIYSLYNETIIGDGELLYLTLKADETFASSGKIHFDNIHLSDITGHENIPLNPFDVFVSAKIGNVATSNEAFSIKPGEKQTVDIIMNNTIDICGVQGKVTLPAGLTFVKNSRDRVAYTLGERMPNDASVVFNDQNGMFSVSSRTLALLGNEGILFSFEVEASDELAENSEITISDVIVSNANDVDLDFDDVITIKVTNSYLADIAANEAAYTRLTEEIAALQAKLDEAKATIDEECSDVAADFATAEEAIQGQIDALTEQVKTAYEAVELTEESNIDAETAEIEAAIDQLLADAATAQKAYEDEQTKIAANEAAYTRLTEEIAALQAKLDEAKATIDEECTDVADDFIDARIAIQKKIDDLSDKVYEAYNAVELTEESNIDAEKAEIEADIAKLLSDAAAAQEEYNKTTGIGGISADGTSGAGASEVYTLSGSKAGTAVKGSVNIIKTSDGSVKKVFIK